MLVDRNCTKCRLYRTRVNVVVGKGSLKAKILFIGEAPGEHEDKQGKPFVGEAGHRLSWMLGYLNLPFDKVYITNIVKCRPPNNREPYDDEVHSCRRHLVNQILRIKPKLIVLLGDVAAEAFKVKSFSRGKIHYWKKGYKIIKIYHPGRWLRVNKSIKVVRKQLNVIKQFLKLNR